MPTKVAIIGAGMSGLCAGCYLRMNGYDAEIFELHHSPGGLCTSWTRNGYTFDGCLHWLAGSSPSDAFYGLWSELIDMSAVDFANHEVQMRFVAKTGETLDLYTDPDRLERELLEKAPEDARFTRKIVKTIRKFTRFRMPLDQAPEVMSLGKKLQVGLKVAPFLGSILKYGRMSVRQAGERCRSPLLRATFTHSPLFNRLAFFGMIMSMAFAAKKAAGYPVGGSLAFARRFERRFAALDGRIRYGARVTGITVENDAAVGIVLEGGERHPADVVVSAADGHDTIFGLLGGKYTDAKIVDLYGGRDASLSIFPSLVYVSLGISRTLDELPHRIVFELDEPLAIDDATRHATLTATFYNFDPTLAPEGHTCVGVTFDSFGYDAWADLRRRDRARYDAEKRRIADRVVDILEKKIGRIREHVETVDVATPATFQRFTNNWKGAFEGWLPGPGALLKQLRKTLPGLSNFFHIGQWVEPGGGLPNAIRSGRAVAEILCKRDGKRFTTRTDLTDP